MIFVYEVWATLHAHIAKRSNATWAFSQTATTLWINTYRLVIGVEKYCGGVQQYFNNREPTLSSLAKYLFVYPLLLLSHTCFPAGVLHLYQYETDALRKDQRDNWEVVVLQHVGSYRTGSSSQSTVTVPIQRPCESLAQFHIDNTQRPKGWQLSLIKQLTSSSTSQHFRYAHWLLKCKKSYPPQIVVPWKFTMSEQQFSLLQVPLKSDLLSPSAHNLTCTQHTLIIKISFTFCKKIYFQKTVIRFTESHMNFKKHQQQPPTFSFSFWIFFLKIWIRITTHRHHHHHQLFSLSEIFLRKYLFFWEDFQILGSTVLVLCIIYIHTHIYTRNFVNYTILSMSLLSPRPFFVGRRNKIAII